MIEMHDTTSRRDQGSPTSRESTNHATVHVSVGFLPQIARLLAMVAKMTNRTTSTLLAQAITDLVSEVENHGDIESVLGIQPDRYVYRLPDFIGEDSPPSDDIGPARGPQPRYTKRLSGYITPHVAERLDALEREARMGKSSMVRLAVDMYLFELITDNDRIASAARSQT